MMGGRLYAYVRLANGMNFIGPEMTWNGPGLRWIYCGVLSTFMKNGEFELIKWNVTLPTTESLFKPI